MMIIEFALPTASKIPAAMGACIMPHYLVFDCDFPFTKGTIHDMSSS